MSRYLWLLLFAACQTTGLGDEIDAAPAAACDIWTSTLSVQMTWDSSNACRGLLESATFTAYLEPFGYALVTEVGNDVTNQVADIEGEPVCHMHVSIITKTFEIYGFDMLVNNNTVNGTGYYENYTSDCASTFVIEGITTQP